MLLGLGIGKLASAPGRLGKLAFAFDMTQNAVMAGRGGMDIYRNGLNWENGLQLAGGLLGVAGGGTSWIKGNYHSHGTLRGSIARKLGYKWAERFLEVCFAAGTPLLTPTGSKPIEQFQVGDWVLSRPEGDPGALCEAKQVEEVFVRMARILNLHVCGQVIRTTAEHPFWVQGKGWTAAAELKAGDLLSSHDGRWVAVEDLLDTGEYETVYNLRVADYHTYFVGSGGWEFSVWAHNACVYQAADSTGQVLYVGIANRGLNKTAAARLRAATLKTGHPARVIPGLEDVSTDVAEAIEVTLIRHHKRVSEGGTLLNRSRGTRFRTFVGDRLPQLVAIGTKWLKKVGYPGF